MAFSNSALTLRSILPCAVLWLGFLIRAHATVIYSTNGTATPTFDAMAVYSESNFPEFQSVDNNAMQFFPTRTAMLDSITLPLASSGTDHETFEIRADAEGFPGIPLDTILVSGITGVPQLLTGFSTSHALLKTGTPYWLYSDIPPQGSSIGWFIARPTVFGREFHSLNGNTSVNDNQQLAAFALQGTESPEPSTVLLLPIALAILLACSWRRRLLM